MFFGAYYAGVAACMLDARKKKKREDSLLTLPPHVAEKLRREWTEEDRHNELIAAIRSIKIENNVRIF